MVNRAVVQARRLDVIRKGPASVSLPAEFTQLRLSFAQRNAGGHMGARKFAQQSLPSIKFHNPSLQMDVSRVPRSTEDPQNANIAASLQLFKGSEPQPVIDLDVRGLHSDDILAKLIELTGAERIIFDDAARTNPAASGTPVPLS
ncbi:54S ribosomal protein, mitochondrial [Savitreella phatthalungensis]